MRITGTAMARAGALALALAAAPLPAKAAKELAPIPPATVALMAAKGTNTAAPILLRSFKKESEIEVWKRGVGGRYVLLKTFPICRWSGQLGPKTKQGDRQAPEGFYTVAPRQMNPNSSYYLSFDIGFPNAYDRARGYTGSALMVHGTCSSAGCFAMTDAAVGEIYSLAREAFAGGQGAFQFQAYPFRMTAANMARYRTDKHIAFWRELKDGYDRFEATGEPPVVTVSGGRYAFAPSRNPETEARIAAHRAAEEKAIAALVDGGGAAFRATYADGGMHPTFASLLRAGARLGDISRPETLAFAGREVVVVPARRKPQVELAAVTPPPAPGRPAAAPELSVFGARPLGFGVAGAPAANAIPGSARILSGRLAPTPLELALR